MPEAAAVYRWPAVMVVNRYPQALEQFDLATTWMALLIVLGTFSPMRMLPLWSKATDVGAIGFLAAVSDVEPYVAVVVVPGLLTRPWVPSPATRYTVPAASVGAYPRVPEVVLVAM
jgi:hypothetical protein